MATYIFNLCFNLTKFLQAEQRDPFQEPRDGISPWDRFATEEYLRLFEENRNGNESEEEEDEEDDAVNSCSDNNSDFESEEDV